MEINLTVQAALFLKALLLGGVIGMGYDVFRVTRVAFKLSWLFILAEDILFFLLAAILLFRYFLELSGGEVRIFAVLGVLLGWILYFFTLGNLVIGAASRIIGFIGAVFTAVLVPLKNIWAFFLKMVHWGLKLFNSMKNSLKSRLYLLYNDCTSHRRRGVRRLWHTKKQKKDVPP